MNNKYQSIFLIIFSLISFSVESASVGFSNQSSLSSSVGLGDTVSVDIRIVGLGDKTAPSIGSFDFDVNYDSSILNFSSATFGSGLDVFGLGTVNEITENTSWVNFFELSLDFIDDLNTLQSAAFPLLTLNFEAISFGTSALSISSEIFSDASGNVLPVDTFTGQVRVPEPSILLLIALGVSGIGIASRKKQSKNPFRWNGGIRNSSSC